jgi:hypothetical protein
LRPPATQSIRSSCGGSHRQSPEIRERRHELTPNIRMATLSTEVVDAMIGNFDLVWDENEE